LSDPQQSRRHFRRYLMMFPLFLYAHFIDDSFDTLDSLCNLGSALNLGLTIHKSAELDFAITSYHADI
jgi:hypothetical protein